MIRRLCYWLWPLVGIAVALGILYVIPAGYLVPQPTPEEIAKEVVARVNAEREALGLEPLEVDGPLTQMAVWRSEDMVAGDYVGHYPPEGHPTLLDLGAPFDYHCIPDENIATMRLAYGRRLDDVARKAVDSWKGSPGHWKWIISPDEQITGVGVAVGDGYVVITQLFWGGYTATDTEHTQKP